MRVVAVVEDAWRVDRDGVREDEGDWRDDIVAYLTKE